MHITFKPLADLAPGRLEQVARGLEPLTWPIAGAEFGAELLRYYLDVAAENSWAVESDLKPAGTFALTPSKLRPGVWQTSTYVIPRFRGAGVNTAVKEAVVDAVTLTGRRIMMSIDERNVTSLTAASRLLPGYVPARVNDPDRVSIVFDLEAGTPLLVRGGPVRSELIEVIARALERLSS